MATQPPTRPGAATAVTAIALGVDMFLYGSLIPLLPRLPSVEGSPTASATLLATYACALLLATPALGRWVDQRGPRPALLAGLVLLVASTALFAVCVQVEGSRGLLLLVMARALQGAAAAATWVAGLALLAATHPPERRGRVMGAALSAVGVGVLLGPVVSGALSRAAGPRAPFLVVAVLAAADAIARIVLVRSVAATRESVPLRVLVRGPQAGLLLGLTALGAGSIAFIEPVLPLHLSEIGVGSLGIGAVFAAAALGGATAAPLAGVVTDRSGGPRIAAAGCLVLVAGFLLTARDGTAVVVAGVVLVGIGAQLVLAPTLVLVSVLAESRALPAYGAAYALYNLAYTAGLALGPLASGNLTARWSLDAAVGVAAAATALLGLVLAVRPKIAR